MNYLQGKHGIITIVATFLLLSQSHAKPYTPEPRNSNGGGADLDTLVFVHATFRHGNRTRDPNEGFKYDLHGNESEWLPVGMGQLTAVGRNTEYQLGLFLRQRYTGFLPRTYYFKDISVISSIVLRTKESAQLVCAGLYSPPIDYNVWGEGNELGTKWQPIPVTTLGEDDIWINNKVSCPPYDKDYDDALHNQLAPVNARNKDLYDRLTRYTGTNVSSIREVAKIYNTLKVDEENNKSLPTWATPQLLSQLDDFRLAGFQSRTYTDFMKTIKAGPLFFRIQEILNNKTRQELNPNNKMILYSGHDTTLITILNSLGAITQWDPEYGACIMIELHKKNGQYFVQLYYLKSGLEHKVEPVLLRVWKSATPIPLQVFNGLLDKYKITTVEWYKKCGKEQCVK